MPRSSRAPFEVLAAQVLGVGLPLMEVARRRTDFSRPGAYLDDLVAGALLLVAARAARGGQPGGRALLAAVWGVVCGGGWYSVWGQLESTAPRDVSGLPNDVVVAIKLLLYAVAVTCAVLAVRRAAAGPADGPHPNARDTVPHEPKSPDEPAPA